MAIRRQRQVFPSRQRSATNWVRVTSAGSVTIAAGNKALLTSGSLDNPGISETVRRTRGIIHIQSDQAAAIEQQVGAMGMIIVNDLAITAGAGSIPGPFTQRDDDGWFVWQPFVQSGIVSGSAFNAGTIYEFDSKAMRSVDEGFQIAMMVENASATFGLQVLIAFSLLTSRR